MVERKGVAALFLLLIFLDGFSSASAASPAKIVSGLFSSALSHLLKRIWSITPTPKTVISGRPKMKFESGYSVETVFDGSKLGIEPFSVEVAPSGELLVLDSVNSNMYRMSMPLSRYSRPAAGYTGHVDGRPREARMNHPKGFTVDNSGNIYIADTSNMAIRKISDTGVSTIAGGKWNRGGHIDGPSEEAKFSNDFEVVYIASSCSLLVVDRGNQAIREIQLHFDDCAYQYGSDFPEFLCSLLLFSADTCLPCCNIELEEWSLQKIKKPKQNQHQAYYHHQGRVHSWPMQESFEIPHEDEPPPQMETRNPASKKNYAFVSKDLENNHYLKQGRPYLKQQYLQQHRQQSLGPQTYYEQSLENTNEIVFGAVQELNSKRRAVEIKAVDYGEPVYNQYGVRSRVHYNGYSNGF
ncbi:uncharacterized protein LOC109849616 isoform X2 [Asparagus officinalis]|uniref:uncharacterized protein LOC109849616 isoform X2 n=1 Tax=Asparagus officinalis TaxID=4686 RepID=UPI00098DF72C|nr:uncharacterized protein LOC109849616 isoform X2 [Asparagus officinalis]